MGIVIPFLLISGGTFGCLFLTIIFLRIAGRKCVSSRENDEKVFTLAFFHPFCNGGGGGERVLWKIVSAINRLQKDSSWFFRIIIYAAETFPGEDVDSNQAASLAILAKAERLFDIKLADLEVPIQFVFLKSTRYLDAARYPFFTLLGQSLGSMLVAWEALRNSGAPDLFIDTTGFAFTLIVARVLFGCRTAAYVHYPTISTDMLRTVAPSFGVRQQSKHRPNLVHSRRKWVAKSWILSSVKLVYYLAFAFLYGLAGAFCHLCMVNSSWTQGHIRRLWWWVRNVHVVFPPCDTKSLQALPLGGREPVVLSVGQYRAEKDHHLQVRVLATLKQKYGHDQKVQQVRLVMVGGCRNEEDRQRVDSIIKLAKELGVDDQVEVLVNLPYPELRGWLGRAVVGLHTMWNEHFGICVVEYMAAGLLALAHRSGGPLADIVTPYEGQPTGVLAETPEEYADAIANAFQQTEDFELVTRRNGRSSVEKFSDEAFESNFLNIFSSFILSNFR